MSLETVLTLIEFGYIVAAIALIFTAVKEVTHGVHASRLVAALCALAGYYSVTVERCVVSVHDLQRSVSV